jgi:hypothetical protein
MQVRARTLSSMITSTGDVSDPRASSAGLVKSSMMSPNLGKCQACSASSDFHGKKFASRNLRRPASGGGVALDLRTRAQNVGQRTILAHRNKFFSSAPAAPD